MSEAFTRGADRYGQGAGFRVATEQLLVHLDHRLLGVAPGTVGVLFWWKVGFKDRF
jgi:hypothetical protein